MNEKTNSPNVIVEEDEIDLLELLGVLLKHKWMIFWITAAAAAGAVLFSVGSLLLPPEKSYLPNMYSSTAKLLISEDSSGSMIPSSLSSVTSWAGLNIGGGGGYGVLAVELAKSNSIVDIIGEEFDIIQRYDIKKYPKYSLRSETRERLSISYEGDTKILSISYEDWEPEFSRDVVNRIVELLDQRFSTIGINRNLTQKTLLEEKLANVNGEIILLETRIKEFQQRYGVLEVRDLAVEQVTAIAQLRSQLILKELEINTYSEFSRIEDPVLQRMKAERDNLAQLVLQMEEGGEEFSIGAPALSALPELALEFSHLERELLVQAKILEILTQQYELSKLKVEGEEPIFQVLELGDVSDKKSGPSRGMICIVVTFVAFFFAVIAAFVRNAWHNIKNDPERMGKLNLG